jgi:sec-independent protein translocase protein TatA
MGISIWQLLIILAIVLLLFGAKRLRNIGGDLGASVKGFKQAMSDGEKKDDNKQVSEQAADAEKPAEKPAEAAAEDKKAS